RWRCHFTCGQGREKQSPLAIGCNLTRDAHVRQEVPTVGRDLHVEAPVVESERVDERGPGLGAGCELQNAPMVRAEAELVRGAEHTLGNLAPNLRLPDGEP